ncbi:hypothetical protein TNCV_2868621 [Trichonephila clavipes]|nr:hypothetical protein TNCV_2868621 [Trichonephila clavipes]
MEAHGIHHGKRLYIRMSLAVALRSNHGRVSRTFFGSVLLHSRKENTQRWSVASHLSYLPTNLTKVLAARRLVRVPPCRQGVKHFQQFMPSPGYEPEPYGTAVSLTTIPDGRHISSLCFIK